MKIKFWNFEYDFDRDDAKVVVPILLMVIAISVSSVNPLWWLTAAAAYYVLYFFSGSAVEAIRGYIAKRKMRMPTMQKPKNHFADIKVTSPMSSTRIIFAIAARPLQSSPKAACLKLAGSSMLIG